MSGKNESTEMAIPAMPAEVKMIWWLIMNGLGAVVLSVWVYTLISNQEAQQKRLDEKVQIEQAQNERLITVLTKIEQYMEEQKYQNRIQSIRNK